MNKLKLILILLVVPFLSKAQYPINQSIGADSTLITSKGGLKGRFVNFTYLDTAFANLERIKQYPGAQIFTTRDNNLWVRDSSAKKWMPAGGIKIIPNLQQVLLQGGVTTLPISIFNDNTPIGVESTNSQNAISILANSTGPYINMIKGNGDSSLIIRSDSIGFGTRTIQFPNNSGTIALTSDTTSLSSRINAKVNISDTAAMLFPYLKKIDTLSLSARINTKLNISDTTNKWINSVSQPNDSTLTFLKNGVYTSYTLRFTTVDNANRLITIVYNKTGATITKGSAVYINGSHGSATPTIALAKANIESTSARTYGLVEFDIPDNDYGIVIQVGSLLDISLPTGSFTDGATVYLSPTVAGGLTTTKPLAPSHLVTIGTVTRAHPTQGIIQISVKNGFEIYELSDVSVPIIPIDSTILQYSRIDSLWHSVNPTIAMGNRFVKTSDSASMLLPYSRVQRLLDSVTNLKSSIALKVNISDTASMLLPYTKNITTALKLNISDTSGMLSAYLRKADTTGKFITSVFRKTATDSVYFVKGGANTFAFKDSAGGSNIGNSDLSLTSPRTLTLNSNSLYFAGTTTTTFFANGRVTIGGISDAGYKLDVIGGDAQFNNIRVGLGAGGVITNTAVGYQALNANTIGSTNVAVGYQTLKNGNNHQYSVAVGYGALANSASNNSNTAIGYNSMGVTTAAGQANTCVGSDAGKNTTGGYNTFVGFGSGQASTSGSENTAFGAYSFYFNSTGTRNAGFGLQSLYRSTGSDNAASGYFALQSMTSGSKNTALGSYAGDKYGTGTNTNSTSNNSIFIGYDTRPLGLTQTNQVVIGYGTTGLGDNTTVLGNSSTTVTGIYGNIRLVSGMATAPASATATGTVGDVRITATYIYVCTAANTWVRSALTTW